jgi:cytochrome P450
MRAQKEAIREAFMALNQDIAYRLRTVFVPPLWIPTPRNLAFKRARAELDRVVYAMIARRRRSGGQERQDLMDLLLGIQDQQAGDGMSDRQLRDEVMTLMLAGHETTASLLAWTWYLLSRHPAVARKLMAEFDDVLNRRIPQVSDLPALPYSKMVLEEVMRLYPPIWIISRTALDADKIGGHAIPAGTVLVLSQYALHRHPDFWRNPAGFDPERFAPERKQGRHPFAYFPFGGGPRLCIGESFAIMEAQLILATVARRFRLDLAPGQVIEPEPLVTLRPRHGVRMNLTPI